ncbi:MAG: PAS domain-containing protein, partial [Defluviitaleaceae bacterium]|nr:PAS domain-containing protein [Defluviitaleaceae bacterium]
MEKITEKKNMLELGERMGLMLDATPLAAHFWDENFQITDCNQAAVRLFNLSSKQEYIDKYFELTPEFQPDGQRSSDKLRHLLGETYKSGNQRVEWTCKTLDGELIPFELTLVSVEYHDQKLVAGYCRDLREHKRMMGDIEKRDTLLNVINRVAVSLLSAANEEKFEESLIKSMELIGQCLEADCVQIWENKTVNDALCFALKYKWLSDIGLKAPPVAIGTAVPYSERWKELFLRGECVNGPVAELPQEDRDLLGPLGLTSTITIPLYYSEKFWGVFCVDDCVKERYFTEGEVSLLHSAGLMLVNAIKHNLQAEEIREAHRRALLLLDTTPLAVHLWNRDLCLFDCNEEALHLFKVGDKQEYLFGFFERSPEYQSNGVRSRDLAPVYLNKAFDEGKCTFEWTYRTLDGETFPAEITLVRIAYGNDYAVAGYSMDLREHKRMIREIENQRMEAEAASKAKSSF